jgi:hypothetical protein
MELQRSQPVNVQAHQMSHVLQMNRERREEMQVALSVITSIARNSNHGAVLTDMSVACE